MLLAHHLPLKTARLVLRNFEPDDKMQIAKIIGLMYARKANDSHYFLWSSFASVQPKPSARLFMEKADTFVARGLETLNLNHRYRLAVCLPSGEIIGYVGFSYDDSSKEKPNSDLGYFISPPYEGQGYASEALAASLSYYFLKKQELFATAAPENTSSQAVLLKMGGKKSGHINESVHGGPRDIFYINRNNFIRNLSRPKLNSYLLDIPSYAR